MPLLFTASKLNEGVVAAAILAAVEGWRPAARKERWYKMAVPKALWTLDRKQSRALSTTAVNGIIFCLRTLLEQNKTKDLDGYKTGFAKLTQYFTPKKFKYKSSHWKDLGTRIAGECFP